ncbi:MAG: DUF4398 domain-containing protein [Candidatus Tectimicrobiota bacterium]
MTKRVPGGSWSVMLLVCGTLGLSACSAGRAPTAEVAQATLAVQAASQKEAPQYAAAELHTATQELERAQEAMREKEYTSARRFAERALVHAQLAQTMAEAEQTRQAAAALERSIQLLRQEAGSSAPGR